VVGVGGKNRVSRRVQRCVLRRDQKFHTFQKGPQNMYRYRYSTVRY
jgi:hypothetical protein